MQRMQHSFYKECKRMQEHFVLLKRMQKNTRSCVLLKRTEAQPCNFLQLATKHSDTQRFSYRNGCNTVDHKEKVSLINHKHVRDRLRNILTQPVRRNDFSNSVGPLLTLRGFA